MDDDQEQRSAWFHGYVGACLAEHDDQRRVPPVDDDGDYVLTWSGSPIYVSALDGPVRTVRTWAVAANGLRPRAALLRELNDLNRDLPLVSLVLSSHGSVIVASTLVAEAVNAGSLPHAVAAVGTCAEHVGVLLAGAHDGVDAFAVVTEDV